MDSRSSENIKIKHEMYHENIRNVKSLKQKKEEEMTKRRTHYIKRNKWKNMNTWSPAKIDGYKTTELSFWKQGRGCNISSDWMWPKSVEEILHKDSPISVFLLITFTVSFDMITSWNPALIWPPVRYSNCFPACHYYL